MFEKFANIAQRHQSALWKALPYELFVRSYSIPFFRGILKPLFGVKKPKNVFFVLGCYNAGTTVVKDAIALYPDIATAPIEGDLLSDSLDEYESGDWPRCMYANSFQIMQARKNTNINADQIVSDWRPWIRSGKFFLEKSISNTCRIPLLRKAFPCTKFVCVVREPEGVVRGIQRRSRPGKSAARLLDSSVYPDDLLLKQWTFFYRLVLEDCKSSSDDIYFCSYEKFIDEPAEELGRIFNFLNFSGADPVYENSQLLVDGEFLEIRPRKKKKGDVSYLDSVASIQIAIDNILADQEHLV